MQTQQEIEEYEQEVRELAYQLYEDNNREGKPNDAEKNWKDAEEILALNKEMAFWL